MFAEFCKNCAEPEETSPTTEPGQMSTLALAGASGCGSEGAAEDACAGGAAGLEIELIQVGAVVKFAEVILLIKAALRDDTDGSPPVHPTYTGDARREHFIPAFGTLTCV